MNVEIKLQKDLTQPYAIIYAPTLTPEINQIITLLEQKNTTTPLTVKQEDTYHILKPDEIYMVRTEDQQLMLYTKTQHYSCTKRLYEVEQLLGPDFFRISKTTLVNLNFLDSVEPSFNGTMYLKLKNGSKDYISRKYLPEFKNYLGL
ncbi:MAG: LytTR family DNA-binding domain-containing protein [Cellulosilyticaceae bacterium]